MAESAVLARFPADFKKVQGTLTITPSHIAWVPTTAGSMDRQNQAVNRVTNMLASKAGTERISLKILFKDDLPAAGLTFAFSDPSTREADRKLVQDILIPFVQEHREGRPPPAIARLAPPVILGNSAVSGPSTPSGSVGTPTASLMAKGKRKAEENGAQPRTKVAKDELNRTRARVLRKNPNLKMLHRELVLAKQITEDEFWEGREALVEMERLAEEQKPGRSSRLLDDRFDLGAGAKSQMVKGGTGVGIKNKPQEKQIIEISKDLTREIFEEFPVVQDAYAKYVPGQVSESEFWSRYFQSQLWERQRASVRTSAVDDGSRKRDDIFDQYLEDPDWDIEPRRAATDRVEKIIDLAATEEDHGESATQRDVTMQAGRERASLPLMRRFNDHSMRLLQKQGIDTGQQRSMLSNTVLPDNIDIYNEIDLEDLRGPSQDATITLNVNDSDQDVNGNKEDGPVKGIMPGRTAEELLALAAEEAGRLANCEIDFTSISLPTPLGGWEKDRLESGGSAEQAERYNRHQAQKDAGTAAMSVVREMYTASNAENAINPSIPDSIFESMRSCHNAASEFLRQYWSAILPTSSEALGAGTSAASSKAKDAKAAKMASYLKSTEQKVEAIVMAAEIAEIDAGRVRAALAPTLGAVNVALQRENRRTANGHA